MNGSDSEMSDDDLLNRLKPEGIVHFFTTHLESGQIDRALEIWQNYHRIIPNELVISGNYTGRDIRRYITMVEEADECEGRYFAKAVSEACLYHHENHPVIGPIVEGLKETE